MINHWIWGDSTFSDKAIFIFGQRPKQRNSPSCDTEKPQELWMMLKEPEFSAEAHHELNLDSSLSRNASPVFGKSLRLFTQPLLLVYLHWDLESGYIQRCFDYLCLRISSLTWFNTIFLIRSSRPIPNVWTRPNTGYH